MEVEQRMNPRADILELSGRTFDMLDIEKTSSSWHRSRESRIFAEL
jgi:hypothetical protein